MLNVIVFLQSQTVLCTTESVLKNEKFHIELAEWIGCLYDESVCLCVCIRTPVRECLCVLRSVCNPWKNHPAKKLNRVTQIKFWRRLTNSTERKREEEEAAMLEEKMTSVTERMSVCN